MSPLREKWAAPELNRWFAAIRRPYPDNSKAEIRMWLIEFTYGETSVEDARQFLQERKS